MWICVDDRIIIFLVKKHPFTTVGQIKNALQEVGVSVSKSTIKRRLHQSSATPRKTTENNCGGQQKKKKPLHNSWPDQEHSPGGRRICVMCVVQKIKTEGSPQDVNHW